jgi:hypothetical protein
MVQVHIIDMKTGEYLLKSSPERRVSRYNEPEHVNYILPAITKAFDLHAHATRTPIWDDIIALNESYLHIMSPDTVFLFEIVDFVTHATKNLRAWHRVAWGFLKPVGKNGRAVTEPVRLQLFHYPKRIPADNERVPGVYKCWTMKRVKFSSTLYFFLN